MVSGPLAELYEALQRVDNDQLPLADRVQARADFRHYLIGALSTCVSREDWTRCLAAAEQAAADYARTP